MGQNYWQTKRPGLQSFLWLQYRQTEFCCLITVVFLGIIYYVISYSMINQHKYIQIVYFKGPIRASRDLFSYSLIGKISPFLYFTHKSLYVTPKNPIKYVEVGTTILYSCILQFLRIQLKTDGGFCFSTQPHTRGSLWIEF